MTWKEMVASIVLALCVVAFFLNSSGTQQGASPSGGSSGWTAAAEWSIQAGNQYAMLHAGSGGTGLGNTMRLDLHCADGVVSALSFFFTERELRHFCCRCADRGTGILNVRSGINWSRTSWTFQ